LDFLSQKAARLAARSHVEGFNPMLELDIEHEGNDLNASVYGLVNGAAKVFKMLIFFCKII